MRSETDTQNSSSKVDNWINACIVNGKVAIGIDGNDHSGALVILTKQQAREFARQLLEMCGEDDK